MLRRCKGNYHDDAITADDDDCFFGVCGTADNNLDGCDPGTYGFVSGLTWRCMGSDTMSYTDDANCTPVPGLCDYSDAGKCIDGESSDSTGASNPWTCAGTAGAPDATCLLAACDINAQGTCLTGTPTGTTNPWTCEGGDPDPNITADDDEDCTFGVCDYAGPGRCLQGTPSASGHTWTCEGSWRSHTNDDEDCIKAQCREGEDGAVDNSLKGCITGQWDDVDDLTDDVAMWRCLGNAQDPAPPAPAETDDDVDCQVPTTVDIDGICLFVKNSSGQIQYGRCEEGKEPGTDTSPAWTCAGINNGDDDDCVAGQCPAIAADNGTCASGTERHIPGPHYNDGDDWMCKGNHPSPAFTADDVTCMPVIDGVCGNVNNDALGCTEGIYSNIDADTWTCSGINGGENITCPGNTADVSVGCGAQVNTCNPPVGSFSYTGMGHDGNCSAWGSRGITDLADSPTHYLWSCTIGVTGTCGGRTTTNYGSQPCEMLISGPIDGVCGTADNDVQGCTDGTWQDETGDGWTCLGDNGGADVSCGGCNWNAVFSVVTRHWRTGRTDILPNLTFSYPSGVSAWNDLPTDINLFRSRFLQCEGTCPAGQFFLPDTVNGALSYQGGSCHSTLEIDCEASYLGLNNVSECSVRIPGHFSSCTFISDTSGSGSINIQSYVDAGGNNVSTRFYNLESLEVTMTSPGVANLSCQ